MKKYYLSAIFKDMSIPDFPQGVWRHRLQTYTGNVLAFANSGEIAVGPDGAPTQKALLVLVDTVDHTIFKGDAGVVPMPDVSLDVKVAAIDTQTKLLFAQGAKALGLDSGAVDGALSNADGLRDTVNYFGRLNNPAFDANNFDLA